MRSESEDVICHMKCNSEIIEERATAARVTEVKERKEKRPILEILFIPPP